MSDDAGPTRDTVPLWEGPPDWVDATTLPPGIRIFPYDTERPRPCGEIMVHLLVVGEGTQLITRLVDPIGGLLREFKAPDTMHSWVADWCFDVTGDGKPELMLVESTGGAHCCHTYHLFSLTPTVREILTHNAGNGRFGTWPRDLDGKGALELVGTNDALVHVGSMFYAGTFFLPEVFAFDGTRYRRQTSQFRAFLRKDRSETEVQAVAKCAGQPSCWVAYGEYILGLSIYLGDWAVYAPASPIPVTIVTDLNKLHARLQRTLR